MDYKQRYNKLCRQINTDSLTGVLSRRYIDENFERLILEADKNKSDASLAVLDIDHFKRINDTYGHLAGDKILYEMAELLKKQLVFSNNDYLARYGGDEFLLLCVGIDFDEFVNRVKECINTVYSHKFYISDTSVTLTLSAGCTFLYEGCGFASGLNTADKKLYIAKREGRSRAEI